MRRQHRPRRTRRAPSRPLPAPSRPLPRPVPHLEVWRRAKRGTRKPTPSAPPTGSSSLGQQRLRRGERRRARHAADRRRRGRAHVDGPHLERHRARVGPRRVEQALVVEDVEGGEVDVERVAGGWRGWGVRGGGQAFPPPARRARWPEVRHGGSEGGEVPGRVAAARGPPSASPAPPSRAARARAARAAARHATVTPNGTKRPRDGRGAGGRCLPHGGALTRGGRAPPSAHRLGSSRKWSRMASATPGASTSRPPRARSDARNASAISAFD